MRNICRASRFHTRVYVPRVWKFIFNKYIYIKHISISLRRLCGTTMTVLINSALLYNVEQISVHGGRGNVEIITKVLTSLNHETCEDLTRRSRNGDFLIIQAYPESIIISFTLVVGRKLFNQRGLSF